MNDPYIYPGTNTLINYFEIKDAQKLSELEAEIFYSRSLEPLPEGNFDLTHLKSIHSHLFGDLYPWAGEFRTVDIAKGDSFFAHYSHIERCADKLLKDLRNESFFETPANYETCSKLAEYFNELNAIHPFREGNGRVQRAFITEVAKKSGITLTWENVTKEFYIKASIYGFNGDSKPMHEVFEQLKKPLRNEEAPSFELGKKKGKINARKQH